MDVFAETKARLAPYPHLRFLETCDSFEVAPPNPEGFPVALTLEPGGFTVHYGGWNERFESARDALQCFSYGLLGDCRLRVHQRGARAYKWTLEHHRSGEWLAESTKSSLLVPFWRRRRTRILRNETRTASP